GELWNGRISKNPDRYWKRLISRVDTLPQCSQSIITGYVAHQVNTNSPHSQRQAIGERIQRQAHQLRVVVSKRIGGLTGFRLRLHLLQLSDRTQSQERRGAFRDGLR